MFWSFIGLLGSATYIVLMIIPHSLASIFTRSGNLSHIDARYWARWTLFCSRVKVTVEGADNIPDVPAIYMPNHVSHFDVLAILGYLNVQFRWTVKKELFRIPLFAQAMKRAGYIMIDRTDHTKAMASMDVAAQRIRDGASIMIFPEGTRSDDGNIQFPFKKGGFHLAIKSGALIVPITVLGSRDILPKHSLSTKPGTITLRIGKPITPADFESDINPLINAVHEALKQGLAGGE